MQFTIPKTAFAGSAGSSQTQSQPRHFNGFFAFPSQFFLNTLRGCHGPVVSQVLRHATFNNGVVGGAVVSDMGLGSQLRSLAVRKSAVPAHAP